VPEWYLLPYYAILRAIPNKLLGVLAMFGSIFILFVLPWLDRSPVRSARFRPVFRPFLWLLVTDCVLLTFAGGRPPEGTWLMLSRLGTGYYFLHFLVILPLVGWLERPNPLPVSITTSALETAGPRFARAAALPGCLSPGLAVPIRPRPLRLCRPARGPSTISLQDLFRPSIARDPPTCSGGDEHLVD
jgi:hypothetical protein